MFYVKGKQFFLRIVLSPHPVTEQGRQELLKESEKMYGLTSPAECRVYFHEYGEKAFPTYQETAGLIQVQSVAVIAQFGPYSEGPHFQEACQGVLEDAVREFGREQIEGYELVLANAPDLLALSDLQKSQANQQEVVIRA